MPRPRKPIPRDRDGIVVTRKPNGRWMARAWDRTVRAYRSQTFLAEDAARNWAEERQAAFRLGLDSAERATLDGIWTRYKAERMDGGKVKDKTRDSLQRVVDGLRAAGAVDFKGRGFRDAVTRYFRSLHLSRSKAGDGRVAVSTRRRIYSQVRALVNFAQVCGWIVQDPLAGFSPVGDREQDATAKEVLTLAEARALVGLDRPADPSWVYSMLMLYGGLRESEARTMTWADLDWDSRLLWVRRGKGNKVRAVPIPGELFAILGSVAMASGPRAPVAAMPSAPIVARIPGRIVCYQTVRALFKEAGIKTNRGVDEITGMPRHVGRHSLRHTFCAMKLASGTPGEQLRITMGHGSADLTALYGAQVASYVHAVQTERWPMGALCLRREDAVTISMPGATGSQPTQQAG